MFWILVIAASVFVLYKMEEGKIKRKVYKSIPRTPYAGAEYYLGRGEKDNTYYAGETTEYNSYLGIPKQSWKLHNGTRVIHYGFQQENFSR
jgi:hypothetical protein